MNIFFKKFLKIKLISFSTAALVVFIYSTSLYAQDSQSDAPRWYDLNEKIIEEANVAERSRSDIPETNVISNIGAGVVSNMMSLPAIELSEGAFAKAYWGKGALMSFVTMEPNATLPESEIEGERFLFIWEGNVTEKINGEDVELISRKREVPDGTHGATPRKDFVYLQEGAETNVKAGSEGARLLMIYSPVPSFYLQKAGSFVESADIDITEFPIAPSVEPDKVYDLYDFQYTELVPGANARLINGHGTQMSFLRMDPGIEFAYHMHPEEQVMIGLRGYIDEYILADTVRMKAGDMVALPSPWVEGRRTGMVHGGKLGPYGSDALDVFFPPRTDYTASMNAMLDRYHAIIPEDAKVEHLIDGSENQPQLYFTEGPVWLDGKLYFSNMYFDQSFTGDPGRSTLVEMDPDGSYRNIISGEMQSNGIIPSGDGNLIVADMFGHRVIKVSPEGEVLKVLADSYNGKSIDGPNDLVMDQKGGIYFTDPQFTPDAQKNQPGRTVYYQNPDGEVIRLVEPDSFGMPNGVILSPDGKTLYINNTYDTDPQWNTDTDKDNFVWAYDVNSDGTISNGRKFAQLKLTGAVLDRKAHTSGADGMTIDQQGNLYVATYTGVQIFDSEGTYIGNINTPTYPVNVTFGGDDMQTLYITSYDNIYSVSTNMKGLETNNQ